LKKTFEIPKKGVKLYTPDDGWSSSPIENPRPKADNTNVFSSVEKDIEEKEIDKTQPSTSEIQTSQSTDETTEKNGSNNMVAVGDALEQLFETLNNSSNVNSPDENPTWREVAELSRILEEKLDARKDILDKLSLIDEDLHSTRKKLLLTLKKLGKFENEQLSAATIRASVSAMAIEVLAKKLT
tara:strand:+ start:305 stop:856 length:552 start_codon:yes stop_codon:yes gene_type:complete